MNIILVGFMGSGKSTLGKQLAVELNYTFIETDVLVEHSENLTIPEIFKTKGEEYFRNAETGVLHQLKLVKNCVISTGGGMPCFNNNMEVINQLGHSVWLDVTQPELEQRLKNEYFTRPKLLQFESLQQALTVLLHEREPFYKRADSLLSNPTLDSLLRLVQNLH